MISPKEVLKLIPAMLALLQYTDISLPTPIKFNEIQPLDARKVVIDIDPSRSTT